MIFDPHPNIYSKFDQLSSSQLCFKSYLIVDKWRKDVTVTRLHKEPHSNVYQKHFYHISSYEHMRARTPVLFGSVITGFNDTGSPDLHLSLEEGPPSYTGLSRNTDRCLVLHTWLCFYSVTSECGSLQYGGRSRHSASTLICGLLVLLILITGDNLKSWMTSV